MILLQTQVYFVFARPACAQDERVAVKGEATDRAICPIGAKRQTCSTLNLADVQAHRESHHATTHVRFKRY